MALTNKQQRQLAQAFLSAFPTRQDLEMIVSYRLGENLFALTRENSLERTVFQLIRWATAKGRLEELIVAALEQNPRNPELRRVAQELGLTQNQPVTRGFRSDKTAPNPVPAPSQKTPTAHQRSLPEILKEAARPLTPEELFEKTSLQSDSVDHIISFFDQLSNGLSNGSIREVYLNNQRLLEAGN